METRPHRIIKKKKTRKIMVGNIPVGETPLFQFNQ